MGAKVMDFDTRVLSLWGGAPMPCEDRVYPTLAEQREADEQHSALENLVYEMMDAQEVAKPEDLLFQNLFSGGEKRLKEPK